MPDPISDTDLAGLRRTLAEMDAREWGRNIGLDTVLGLLARLGAAEQGRTRAIANQERWLEAAETESIARRAAEADRGRPRRRWSG